MPAGSTASCWCTAAFLAPMKSTSGVMSTLYLYSRKFGFVTTLKKLQVMLTALPDLPCLLSMCCRAPQRLHSFRSLFHSLDNKAINICS